ncbi:hypothetical protein BJY00DRAFT_276852 [Aspergillus carlsbadensis]|nr:hypothetical protein BJY00DRAFT_276852 [Aspergillus carlsbadensis]
MGNSPDSSLRRVSSRLMGRTRLCTALPHIRTTRNLLCRIIDWLKLTIASVSIFWVGRKDCADSTKALRMGFAAQVKEFVTFHPLS